MASCLIFHDWSDYEPPKQVEADQSPGVPTVAQRRECKRCKAVDYRRVLVHN